MRTQVERLSARLDRLSELLEQKTADYDALKAEFDKSTQLINELLTPENPSITPKPAEAEAEKTPTAEQMLAQLNAELRETRAELAALEKDAAASELHILELEDQQRIHQTAAARALVRAGSAAAPALADLLSDRRPEIRRWAATMLGEIGPDASSAVDALRDAFSDPDEDVGIAARRAVRRIEDP
jgi:HEAT repeat protein